MIKKNLKDLYYVSAYELKLPKWGTVSKERFNKILSIVTKAKKVD